MAKSKVLDTNILVLAVRNSPIWQKISEKYEIQFQDAYISIVSEAEILSLAAQFEWGEAKYEQLKALLQNVTIVPISDANLISAYIEIDLYSQKKLKGVSYPPDFSSRNMGKNDIWIAATAYVTNSTLFTLDKDFEHLKEVYIEVEWININE